MKASNKSPKITQALNQLTEIIFNGKTREACISEGVCISCDEAKDLKATSFDDDISRKEYAISGMCQSCQDDVFGVSDEDEDDGYGEEEPREDFGWAGDEDAFTSAGWGMDESYF